MREILFRGKRTDNGEWVEGNLIRYLNGQSAILEISGLRVFSVVPSTVGQYTGQKDRNGQKIFEGDILSLPEEEYANIKLLVEFRDCGWKLRWHGDKSFNHELAAWDGKRLNFKVVGNIHDNPELLKKEE